MQDKTGLIAIGWILVNIGLLLFLIAICCDLYGCTVPVDKSADYENARRAAVDAWEEIIGRVSDKCYERSVNAIVSENDNFPESCLVPDGIGVGDLIFGCYIPVKDIEIGDDIIYILDTRTELQKTDTAVHEFIHLLDRCERDDGNLIDMGMVAECTLQLASEGKPGDECRMPGDYFHLEKELWDRYGPDTVEAVGCANLIL